MNDYISYLTAMKQAELSLFKHETQLMSRLAKNFYNTLGTEVEIKKILSSSEDLMGFTPDHLEYGCKEGIFVFKITSQPLEILWAMRLY